MDGSSFSSPLESPEAPITTSSAATLLQSAESLSVRRQVRQTLGHCVGQIDNFHYRHNPEHELLLSGLHDGRGSMLSRRSYYCHRQTLLTSSSLSKTPDTPSAIITSNSHSYSSSHSQAFTSHFTSEGSPLQRIKSHEDGSSPSALLTPSTDTTTSSDTDNCSSDEFLKLDGDTWDITNFEYDLQSLHIDDYFDK